MAENVKTFMSLAWLAWGLMADGVDDVLFVGQRPGFVGVNIAL